jgi:hypothetical protein
LKEEIIRQKEIMNQEKDEIRLEIAEESSKVEQKQAQVDEIKTDIIQMALVTKTLTGLNNELTAKVRCLDLKVDEQA